MKLKSIFMISVVVFLVLLCSACNGDVTRDIRHAGFNVGDKFTCSDFFPSKDSTGYKKVRYFTGTRLIDTNGEIYEISMSQLYANKENCKKADTSIEVVSILDNKIVKSYDNKYYYLEGQNSVASYSVVPDTDNSYNLYNLLLKGEDVVKVITADSSKGLYYVLKSDGNVYGITISSNNNKPKMTGTSLVYDKLDYDSKIIDFNYAGDSLNTFIRTEDTIYRMKITNLNECSKYADVSCKYELKEDEVLKKYKDRIILFNGSTLITDYNLTFSVTK